MNPLLKRPKLLGWVRDTTAPTLTTVTFSSNNSTTTLAKVGDIVTLAFVPSEAIYNLVVSIAGHNVTPTQVNPLSYTVAYTLVSGDTSGSIPFTIDFKDVNGVSGTQVIVSTGGEIVTFDKTVPTLLSASRQSATVLFVTLSENADDATLTQANDGGFLVKETGTPATAYVVSATAKQGSNSNIVELTVADMTASAIPGVTVTYATGGNALITDALGNPMLTNATGVATGTWA